MVMCLGQGADLHMVQLMPLPSLYLAPVNPDWFYLPCFTFLMPTYPGSPRQNPRGPENGCVCVRVCSEIKAIILTFNFKKPASPPSPPFPSETELVWCPNVSLPASDLTKNLWQQVAPVFSQVRRPSCLLTNDLKALKKTPSTDYSWWRSTSGFILSWSNITLLLYQLSKRVYQYPFYTY